MEYIHIKNWDDFQHYTKRNPPWIKLHTSLLDNDDFDRLQDDSKALLICLWLFTARKGNGKIQADINYLKRKLPISKKVRLQPLIDTGFIECLQDDSTPQAIGDSKVLSLDRGETEERQRRGDTIVREVFDLWNKQKEKWPRWKTHRLVNEKVPPDICAVLLPILKKWSVVDVEGAIINYAWTFGSPESKWTYRWGLIEFFTRHDTDRNLQWEKRFLPSNFSQDDYLTPAAKQKRAASARTAFQKQEEKSYTPATEEEKQQVRLNLPQMGKVPAARLTPEQKAEQVRKQKQALGARQ